MVRCEADPVLERKQIDGFEFPLGVYPVEEMTPRAGYTVEFEAADGDDEGGEWEEWPDRYVFDIVVPVNRVESLWRALLAQMPARLYPILDFIGHDAFREIDPYIAYDLLGQDRMIDAVRRFRDFFFEDGMVGFGAVCDEPFAYVFVDEHKVVTVRAEASRRPAVEALLDAFDLEQVDTPSGADAAAHEHRGVLLTPKDNTELLGGEEIVERLREEWRLVLNVDPESNVDDDGRDLGITAWRCLVRCVLDESGLGRYAEIVVAAGSLTRAEELAHEGATSLIDDGRGEWLDLAVVAVDRLAGDQFDELVAAIEPASFTTRKRPVSGGRFRTAELVSARWLG